MASKTIDFWDVDQVRSALTDTDWGYITRYNQVEQYICPICSSSVPATADPTAPKSPRAHHTDWHVSLAEAIQHLLQKGKA